MGVPLSRGKVGMGVERISPIGQGVRITVCVRDLTCGAN
jgi:hypothetical protein